MLKLDVHSAFAERSADGVNESESLFSAKIPQRNAGDDKIWLFYSAFAQFLKQMLGRARKQFNPAVEAGVRKVASMVARQSRIDLTGQDSRFRTSCGQSQSEGSVA